MVLRTAKILILPFLMSFCLLTSCEDLYMVDCSECTFTEPTSCLLRIELGETYNRGVPYEITIYRGTIEDGIVIFNQNIYTNFTYTVSINSEYTVTASVEENGKEYVAVDATTPRTRRIEDVCEETCYIVVDNTVDLEIKYY